MRADDQAMIVSPLILTERPSIRATISSKDYSWLSIRWPKIDPPPAPGLPSVLAALQAIKAKYRL